jgi:hypothetical protein
VSTNVVVFLGTSCVFSWLIAYVGIIRRGFKDKAFGMPIAAIAANISWEAIYSFFFEPLGDYLHILSIPCFFIDVIIAMQCFRYGAKDFSSPFVQKYFKAIFLFAIAVAFPIVFLGFYEFHDPAGEYTGFGINFMMSLLFVAMLLRRDGPAGQSMYIAVFKWLGTLFAYIATAVEATTDQTHPWPDSLSSFMLNTITHKTYPLTPLISFLYLVTFFVDILYIVLLYRSLKARNIAPWTRF